MNILSNLAKTMEIDVPDLLATSSPMKLVRIKVFENGFQRS